MDLTKRKSLKSLVASVIGIFGLVGGWFSPSLALDSVPFSVTYQIISSVEGPGGLAVTLECQVTNLSEVLATNTDVRLVTALDPTVSIGAFTAGDLLETESKSVTTTLTLAPNTFESLQKGEVTFQISYSDQLGNRREADIKGASLL